MIRRECDMCPARTCDCVPVIADAPPRGRTISRRAMVSWGPSSAKEGNIVNPHTRPTHKTAQDPWTPVEKVGTARRWRPSPLFLARAKMLWAKLRYGMGFQECSHSGIRFRQDLVRVRPSQLGSVAAEIGKDER